MIQPEESAIPSVEEVIARRDNVTEHEAEIFCQEKGAKIEIWKNGKKYCIFPEGYGCEPINFFNGACGVFD